MYVKRDDNSTVKAISLEPEGEIKEFIDDDSPELSEFLAGGKPQVHQFLEDSDLQMARIMEDTVNLLIDKGVIQFTELPRAAQEKLLSRKNVRGQALSIGLLDDDSIGL